MKTKKNLTMLLLLGFCLTGQLHAQVTIGSGKIPNKGSLLDLKEDGETKRGLGLPRVNLKALTTTSSDLKVTVDGATGTAWGKSEHIGLVVYNVNTVETETVRVCPGIHVWDGNAWQPLIPYGEIREQEILNIAKATTRNFEYLEADPTHPDFDVSLWPSDKQAAAQNGDYILGNSKTVQTSDHEGNKYNTSRFYVGYRTRKGTLTLQRSYKCDSTAAPDWKDVAGGSKEGVIKTFIDGIWTTQNMRAKSLPNGVAIPIYIKNTADDPIKPFYAIPNLLASLTAAHGLLYNWPAALNMGTGAGQTPNPGQVEQGGGSKEDVFARGICPAGWHLPSDQEFVDLENGIILKTSLFSTTTDIRTLITYDAQGTRGTHGTAMKTKAPINGLATQGTSNPTSAGGFDAYLAGNLQDKGAVQFWGTAGYFWTSSRADGAANRSWLRFVSVASSHKKENVYRQGGPAHVLFSVRCIIDN